LRLTKNRLRFPATLYFVDSPEARGALDPGSHTPNIFLYFFFPRFFPLPHALFLEKRSSLSPLKICQVLILFPPLHCKRVLSKSLWQLWRLSSLLGDFLFLLSFPLLATFQRRSSHASLPLPSLTPPRTSFFFSLLL